MARVGLHRGLVRLRRAVGRREPLLAELAQPEEQLDPLGAGGLPRALRQHVRELRPALEARVDPLERRERGRGRPGVERDGAAQERGGAREIGELLLVERAQPEGHLRDVGRREPLELVLVDRRELLVVPALLRERLHPLPEGAVGGVHAERLAEGEEREVGLAELLLAQVGELDEERLALDGVGALARADLEHRGLAEGVALGGVRGLEGERRARVRRVLLEQRLEARDRLRVVRASPEHLLVQRERALAVEESGLLQLGQPVLQPDQRGRVAGLGGEGDLAGEDLAEIHPALRLRAEPVEPRVRLAVLRRDLDEPLRGDDRARRVAEPLVLHGGEIREQPRPHLDVLLAHHRPPDRLRERVRVRASAERLDEAEHRLAVLGDEVQHALPRLRGARRLRLGEARDPALVLGPGGGLARAIRVLREDRGVLVREPRRGGVRPHEGERVLRVRIRGERAPRREERQLRVPQRTAVRLGDAAEEGRARGGIRLVRGPGLERVDDLLVLALGGVDRLEHERGLDRGRARAARELLERGERRRVARHLREDLAVAGERALRVGEALVPDPAEPEPQLGRLGHEVGLAVGDPDLAAEDLRELVPALGGAEQLPEQTERVRVLGVHREDLPVRGDGAFAIGELFGHDLRHLEQEFLARRHCRRDVGEPLQRPRELARRAGLPVHAGERTERLRGGRLRGDLLEPLRSEIETPEPLRREYGEPPPHVECRLARQIRAERVLERARELRPRTRRRGQPLEVRAGTGGVLAALDRVLELPELRPERLGPIAEPLVEGGDLREEAGPLGAVGGLEAHLEQRRELPRVAGGPVDVLEQAGRVSGDLGPLQHPLERRDGAGLAGALGEHLRVDLDRAARLGARLEQRAAAQQEREAARRIADRRGGERREDLVELGAGLRARQQPLEPEQRLERARVGGPGRAERLERGGRVPHLLDELRRVEQEPEPLRAGGERRAPPRDVQDLGGGARGGVEPLERLERLRVVGRGREHPLPRLDGRGAALRRAGARGPAEQRQRLVRRRARGRLVEHRRELLLVSGLAREPGEVLLGRGARRAALPERAARGDEGEVGSGEVALEQRPQLGEEPRALSRLLDRGEARLAHRDPAGVLARGAQGRVGGLERLAPDRAGDGRERDERLARGDAPRVAAQEVAVQRERAGGVAEPLAPELRERRGDLRLERAGEPGLEHPGELLRTIELHVEPLEGGPRVRVVREPGDLRPRRGRPRRVGEPVLGDRGLLPEGVLPLRRVGSATGELRADVGELAPALAGAVEAPERGEGLAVARGRRERAGPRLGGAVAVEPPVGEVGPLAEERAPQLGRGGVAQLVVEPRARLELLALGGEAAQLAAGLGVARVSPHRLRARGEREGELVQLVLGDPRRAEVRGGAGARVGVGAGLGLERAHALPRIRMRRQRARRDEHRLGVGALELLLDRRERGGVLRVREERGRDPLRRAARVAEARGDPRGLERRAGGLGGVPRRLRELPERGARARPRRRPRRARPRAARAAVRAAPGPPRRRPRAARRPPRRGRAAARRAPRRAARGARPAPDPARPRRGSRAARPPRPTARPRAWRA